MTRPRMLLLTPDFPPAVGGIQRLLGAVAEHLSDDWDVTVVAPADTSGGVGRSGGGVRVVRTRAAWGGRMSALVLAEMIAIAASQPADLSVAGHLACVPAALVARPGTPVAMWAYGSELWAPVSRIVLARCASRLWRVLAISSFTAQQAALAGVDPSRIRICPPGIDSLPTHHAADMVRLDGLGLLDRDGRARPYVVTVARLAEPHKGHELLLRTWPALSARHPGARCVIVGDGPLRDRFRRVSRAAGADETVCWLGQLDELDKRLVLSQARTLVMASTVEPAAAQFEGFGLTYLEAAQLGRPSIAAGAAGPAEVVEDRITGLIVPPGDQVAMFEAIDRMLCDAELADRLGRAARARVERHATWDARMPAIRAALAEATACGT